VDPTEMPYATFAFLLVGKDLGYYAYHRFLHEFHIGWSAHSVHHSGEDYNMATGLRQGALQTLFSPPFYMWMALFGIPPQAFCAHAQLNTLFMYWIHTDLIGRLPFGLEYILNSPMQHRMHHRPPGNRNYGGVFVVWDRLFGTYVPELVRKDFYGNGDQPNTFDPVTLNTRHLVRMRRNLRHKSGLALLLARRVPARWSVSLRALWAPIPEQRDDTRANGPVRPKWNGAQEMGTATVVALVGLAAGALVGLVWLLLEARSMPRADAFAGCFTALLVLSALTRVCDMRDGEWKVALLTASVSLVSLAALLKFRPLSAVLDGRTVSK